MRPTLYILGTSNSILQDGYVKCLREHYKINNLSIGASPFYQYVFNVCQIDEKKFCEERGIVIIENIVNDDNIFYNSELQSSVEDSLRHAILFAASRFPTIVVEFLNRRHYKERKKSFFSVRSRDICSEFGIPFFSFNDLLREKYKHLSVDECYADVSHITPELAYKIAPHLVQFIDGIDWSRRGAKKDLSAYYSSYRYLPAEGANQLVGTSLRRLHVRELSDRDHLSLKGEYFLEALVLDISRTNCILELTADYGTYYQGLRYEEKQKPQFKIVALMPADCSGGLKFRILSQKALHAKIGVDKNKTVQVSPHEDCISADIDKVCAGLVGLIVRHKKQNACTAHDSPEGVTMTTDKTRFVIIANPRTGTNHLIDLLNSHQDITCHREVFHRDAVYLLEGTRTELVKKRNQDPLAFLRGLYDSSPTRACGFKIFVNHDDSVLEAVLRDPGIKKIVLYRSNPLAVYSSDMIAAAEKCYLIVEKTRDRIDAGANDGPRTRAKAIFDRKGFEFYRDAYEAHYRHAIEVLNETNQDYVFLTYEDYINEGLFRRVFPFLGLSQPKELHTRMKKMNASDILSRFVNPDDVRAYLREIGKPNWAHECFMLWPKAESVMNVVCGMPARSTRGDERHERSAGERETGRREPGTFHAAGIGAESAEGATYGKSAGKKQVLLFVDYTVPHYDMFAGSRTNLMYLALLVKMGLDVKFLPADFRRVEPYSSELNDLGIETLDGEWHRKNWERWFRDNGQNIDYVFFYKPNPAVKFLEAVQKYTKAAIIYQCCDLHYLRLRREARVKNDKKILAEADLYEKKEDFLFSSSDVLLTFSEMEEKIISEKFPHKRVFTVPLYFYEEAPSPAPDFSKRHGLLFVGGFAHTPNRDAVSWFCGEVLPLVRRQIPDVVFHVAGGNPPKDISALHSKDVRIYGKVSEKKLKELYESARLVVIPLRFGAGVKGKTIESLYHGVPVVSTSIGLEGIKGIDRILAPKDDPAGFAAQVVALYKDEERWKELGRREAAFVAEAFTSQKTEALMSGILASALKEAATRIAEAPPIRTVQDTPRLIAFYLPQYHPIPENDEWWGKGFTEWRNVAKAEPLFPGHYQPHIPADLGFYDLRLEETRIAQAKLAREYGVYGFCYYHYWFNGKQLLERPLNEMLRSDKPDFPFCICWANENWTRRWDGEDKQVLMKLKYNEEDDRRHIRELFRVFEDRRYIRINGKPLFLVYRTENIPDPRKTAEVWREEARKAGIGELYLVRVESIGRTDPRLIGFDAALEFAPDWSVKGTKIRAHHEKLDERLLNPQIPGDLYEKNYVHYYDTLASNMMKKSAPDYTWFRCVTPSWDNSARRLEGAHIFLGSTPEKYRDWLKHAIGFTNTNAQLSGDEKMLFVNAWNEWAEGNHLEPDQKFGRSYLEATSQAIKDASGDSGREFAIAQAPASSVPPLPDDAGWKQTLGIIRKLRADREQKIAELERQLVGKDVLFEQRKLQIMDREVRIRGLLESVSWRVTSPLRRGHEILLKLKRKARR